MSSCGPCPAAPPGPLSPPLPIPPCPGSGFHFLKKSLEEPRPIRVPRQGWQSHGQAGAPTGRRPGEGGPPSGVSLTVEAATVIRVLWEESAWWTSPWSPAGTARPRFTWLSSLPVGSSLGLRPRAQAAPPPHGTLPRTSEPALARLSGYVTPSVFSSQVSLCGKDSSCLVCCPVAQACLTK